VGVELKSIGAPHGPQYAAVIETSAPQEGHFMAAEIQTLGYSFNIRFCG
jgi:hypothetical protein